MLASSLVLAGCAPASPELNAAASQTPCFQARLARTYSRLGPRTLLVEAGTRGTYRMAMIDSCPDLEWANEATFSGRSGATFVCSALDAEIVFPREGRRETCLFSHMSRLSNAEAAALADGPRRAFRIWRPERPRWPPIIRRPGLSPPAPDPPPPPADP